MTPQPFTPSPDQQRWLIVNADDFGLSVGVNQGILRASREGILTSASLMVYGVAAVHAVQSSPGMDLGLHLDLAEWRYRDGSWALVYERASLEDRRAIETEIHRQLDLFCEMTGRLPTHLDSHQHVHRDEPVRSIAVQLANDLGVALRGQSPRIRYCGAFYGQSGQGHSIVEAISVESLQGLLSALPAGVTELACHPGADAALDSPYRTERMVEVETLCDPRIRRALQMQRIGLLTFEGADALSRAPAARAEPITFSPRHSQ